METEILNKILLKLDNLEKGQKKLEQGQKEIRKDIKILNDSVQALFEDILMLDNRTISLKK